MPVWHHSMSQPRPKNGAGSGEKPSRPPSGEMRVSKPATPPPAPVISSARLGRLLKGLPAVRMTKR
jgi:hypothetical protein